MAHLLKFPSPLYIGPSKFVSLQAKAKLSSKIHGESQLDILIKKVSTQSF